VPVIVPAGCWLSEQIAEPIFRHQQRLAAELPRVARIEGDALSWQTAECARGNTLSFDGAAATGECATPPGATDLLVWFRRVQPSGPGTYVRIEAELLDAAGEVLSRQSQIVGRRKTLEPASALFRLSAETRRLRLAWRNAYYDGEVIVGDLALEFLSSASRPSGGCPEGAVGLIAASIAEVPGLLRDMQRHYEHYRRSAEQFARQWNQHHDPKRTIGALLHWAEEESPAALQRAA
jgi:hypothetical protein